MGAAEERTELKRIAGEVLEELRKFTGSIAAYRKRIDIVINHLLSDADSLALAAADEKTSAPVTKHVTYDRTAVKDSPVEEPTPVLAAGKRACSNCRKPGHRVQNCPEPNRKDLAEAVKKGLKVKRKKLS